MFSPIMDALSILTKLYARLHNYPGIPYWVMTPFRKAVRSVANRILPKYLATPHIQDSKRQDSVIVSFTSFPSRINEVWQVVSCMLLQTLQPREIILWLSKDQFPTKESIPDSLRRLEGDRFKIQMVDGDIRSHKKYFYAAKEYPDDYVFLIDDDIYYPSTIIEKTWEAHLAHPESVICNYGYHMRYREDGTVDRYREWQQCYDNSEADDLFFGSGGGTLLKLSSLSASLTDIELAIRLAPLADDIWLNAMVRLNRIPIVLLQNGLILPIAIKNNKKLASENRDMYKNDEQLTKVINHFMDVCEINPFIQAK
mgnify:CR=1 FL=1